MTGIKSSQFAHNFFFLKKWGQILANTNLNKFCLNFSFFHLNELMYFLLSGKILARWVCKSNKNINSLHPAKS